MFPVQPQPAGLPSGTIGGRSRRRPGAWQWAHVQATPLRLVLLAALALATLGLLPWLILAALSSLSLIHLPWLLPRTEALALVGSFSLPPALLAALMHAVAPAWLGVAPARIRTLHLPLGLMLAGWALALPGLHGSRALLSLGLGLVALGFALQAGRLAVMCLERQHADTWHARWLLVGAAVVGLSLWAAALSLALRQEATLSALLPVVWWGGYAVMTLTLAHRALPHFVAVTLPSQAAWRPRVLLSLLACVLLLQAGLAALAVVLPMQGGATAMLADMLAAVRGASQLATGLLLCWLALRWGLRDSLLRRRAEAHAHSPWSPSSLDPAAAPLPALWAGRGSLRLLAMLHLAFAWLAVACILGGTAQLAGCWMGVSQPADMGSAAMLALALGFVGTGAMALATQAVLAQTGRPLQADAWSWVLSGTLQLGVVFAVGSRLLPSATPLALVAAQFIIVAAISWGLRTARWIGRARVDGQPS